jgi:hypothetical protein
VFSEEDIASSKKDIVFSEDDIVSSEDDIAFNEEESNDPFTGNIYNKKCIVFYNDSLFFTNNIKIQ